MAKEWLGLDPTCASTSFPPLPSSSTCDVGPRYKHWRSELLHPHHRSPLWQQEEHLHAPLLCLAFVGAAPSWRPCSLIPRIWIYRGKRSEGLCVCVRERENAIWVEVIRFARWWGRRRGGEHIKGQEHAPTWPMGLGRPPRLLQSMGREEGGSGCRACARCSDRGRVQHGRHAPLGRRRGRRRRGWGGERVAGRELGDWGGCGSRELGLGLGHIAACYI
jgi:hypothetical protein